MDRTGSAWDRWSGGRLVLPSALPCCVVKGQGPSGTDGQEEDLCYPLLYPAVSLRDRTGSLWDRWSGGRLVQPSALPCCIVKGQDRVRLGQVVRRKTCATLCLVQVDSSDLELHPSWWNLSKPTTMSDMTGLVNTGAEPSWVPSPEPALPNWSGSKLQTKV